MEKGHRSKVGQSNAKKWECFAGIADSGADLEKGCLVSLIKVSGYWGFEKVRHYGWASIGLKFYKTLSTTTSHNPN